MDIDDEHPEIKRETEVAKNWSDAELAATVRRYLLEMMDGDESWLAGCVLSRLGFRVQPIVLQILNDTSLYESLLRKTGRKTSDDSLFQRACDLIDWVPPVEAIPAVAPFLDAPSYWVRADAAFVLGRICTLACIPWLRKAFADHEAHVCSSALIGMGHAAREGRISQECARALYGDVKRLVFDNEHCSSACELLLYFDRATTEFLLSDAMLPVELPEVLRDVLSALVEMRVPVPRKRLLAIIAQVESPELEYPFTNILGDALHLLGRHRVPEDRRVLEARMAPSVKRRWEWQFDDRPVRSGAARGLLASHGLEDFDKQMTTIVKERGYQALTVPQRYYLAGWEFEIGVGHGSPEEYFAGQAADHWPDALAGLEAMGEEEPLMCLRSWINEFGEAGPSLDRDERRKQLAELPRDEDGPFDCPSQFYEEVLDDLELLATRYVVEHAQDFR